MSGGIVLPNGMAGQVAVQIKHIAADIAQPSAFVVNGSHGPELIMVGGMSQVLHVAALIAGGIVAQPAADGACLSTHAEGIARESIAVARALIAEAAKPVSQTETV